MDETFLEELRDSLLEMKAIERSEAEPALEYRYPAPDVRAIRERLKLSRKEFSLLLGISERTLENWEQGRRHPTGPALRLLRVAEKHPEAVLDARIPALHSG